MGGNSRVTVFCTENCPRCEQVKGALKDLSIDFDARDMSTAESLADLRVNGVSATPAPQVIL